MTISTTTLKNAARAIECDLWTDSDGANYLAKDGAILRRWEPADSDGDSFGLMTKLRLDVGYFPGFAEVHVSDERGDKIFIAKYTDDIAHDTRLAIVECAAYIGAAIYSPENP